jgi:redox-sensitive bicupin YhaK (pirin superfamily)
MKTHRKVTETIKARPTSDGDGVKLLRVFGGVKPERFDPFLMLDEFGSVEAFDYLGGFPAHPHRGFETVTYMLEGKMEHQDHMGNVGLLSDGGVQWMSAAGGVIHSEMPKQTEGRMRGFQLWVNLPAIKKMEPASYEDVRAEELPVYHLEAARIKAIAGKTIVNDVEIVGRFTQVATSPVYLDVLLHAGQSVTIPVTQSQTVLVYVYEGEVTVGDTSTKLGAQHLARLTDGDSLLLQNPLQEAAPAQQLSPLKATSQHSPQRSLQQSSQVETRLLVLAAEPLREPIVQYGPFVMNSAAEIEQALSDYRSGTLVAR